MVPAYGAAPRWAEGARPGLGRGLMSKWKCRVEPEGTLRGHFLPSSGWENETEKRQPPGPHSPWQHSRAGLGRSAPVPRTAVLCGVAHKTAPGPQVRRPSLPGALGGQHTPTSCCSNKGGPGPCVALQGCRVPGEPRTLVRRKGQASGWPRPSGESRQKEDRRKENNWFRTSSTLPKDQLLRALVLT